MMLYVEMSNAPGVFAMIDHADEPLLQFTWLLTTAGYALRGVDHLLLHRAVTHAWDGIIVDHIDGVKLDCRRANLRFVTATENARNIAASQRDSFSKLSGVIWNAQRSKWQASIRVNGKLKHLGLHTYLDDAKAARAAAEVELWGVQPRRREALEAALGRTLTEHESNGLVCQSV